MPRMTALLGPLAAAVPSEALLRRMAGSGPRDTSYPTADRFDDSFGAPQLEALRAAVAVRARPVLRIGL